MQQQEIIGKKTEHPNMAPLHGWLRFLTREQELPDSDFLGLVCKYGIPRRTPASLPTKASHKIFLVVIWTKKFFVIYRMCFIYPVHLYLQPL